MDENLFRKLFDNSHSFDYDKIESPIEEFLLNHLDKFLNDETKVVLQYPVSTISGNFRTDIALINNERILVIECDGEEHHTKDRDDWYDEWRDTLILIQKKVHVIYRVKGIDIQNNIYKVFAIIYAHDESFFNPEYAERLEKFNFDGSWYKKKVYYNYQNEYGQIIPSYVEVKRKELEHDFDVFWYIYVLYSLLHPNKNVHELIGVMSSTHYMTAELIKMINEKYPDLNLENETQLSTIY